MPPSAPQLPEYRAMLGLETVPVILTWSWYPVATKVYQTSFAGDAMEVEVPEQPIPMYKYGLAGVARLMVPAIFNAAPTPDGQGDGVGKLPIT